MSASENASAVCEAIFAAGWFRHEAPHGGNWPWYDDAATKMALSTGDTKVKYVCHDIGDTWAPAAATIVVLTERHVAVAKIADISSASVAADVFAVSHSRIEAVKVVRASNLVPLGLRLRTVHELSIEIVVAGELLTLPLTDASPGDVTALADLLPSLVEQSGTARNS